ncbi:B3 domain-containing protein REM9 [Gossypium raimondii]|nr:B3 domain-containing protein REM9 [Gossypium raimondii]
MWPMNTTESGRQVRLGGGWSQFLHENDIVVGDTLLFQHIPNASNLVHVQILNKAGYRNHGRGGRRGRQNKQANASEKNTIIAIKQKRGPPCRQIEEPNSKITKGLSIGGERDITRKDEFESELTPKKASFVVVLKQYQKFYIPVPTSVAKEMGLTKEPSTVIKDSKGRKWRLNILVYARSVHLGAGWSKFMEENKLEVGDTLLFQHIPNTGNVIYFHIIRKARDGNHGKRKN